MIVIGWSGALIILSDEELAYVGSGVKGVGCYFLAAVSGPQGLCIRYFTSNSLSYIRFSVC